VTPASRVVLPGEPIVNEATSLRPWRDTDVADLVTICQDLEIARWTRVPSPYRETDARAFLLHRYELIHEGLSAPFAVVATDGGELLGAVALTRIDWPNLRAEIGYWLGAHARGQGHATRAVGALTRWGFGTLGLERITLLAATINAPSQAVAERAGFSREAVLRSYNATRHGRFDMVAFGLLPGDNG
jgi:RimJ/RimL family protein N-acetyltransferase